MSAPAADTLPPAPGNRAAADTLPPAPGASDPGAPPPVASPAAGDHAGGIDPEATLAALSNEQKASLLAGSGFWLTTSLAEEGIPAITVTDGPHGLRKQTGAADHVGLNASAPATCFPAACATACSFDERLLRDIGRALGEECRAEGVGAILGPGVNVKRHPLGGRNFEYLSEDPLLAGRLGAAMVEGAQSTGVGACVKHFAANSQETARMTSDSIVDERALNEIYLRPFEIVVRRAQPWLAMTAYNRLNGTYCSQNAWLLQRKLRGEWGFAGAAVTDWGALSESAASVAAGLDLVMPGPRPDHARRVLEAVERGDLEAAALDDAARRVLELVAKAQAGRELPFECDIDAHLGLAARAAEESAVLLENDGTLPISPDARVAVIGAFAKEPRYQGAGSSRINPVALDCPWGALAETGVDVAYAAGYDAATGDAAEGQLAEAEALARSRDVAIVFVGLPARCESEGRDRADMAMPAGMNRLVARVAEANPRTVVVLACGAPVELPWAAAAASRSATSRSAASASPAAPRPAAVLLVHLAGCQGGKATARLLLGQANPSGKLAETWPRSLADTALGAAFPFRDREIAYRESIYVGYRYYDAAGAEVAYPFGHGLSYTRFAYRDLRIEPAESGIRVSFAIDNVGERDGAEAAQVYVAPLDAAGFAPPQQLASFAKPLVAAGGTARVEIALDERSFARWDADSHGWRVDEGRYEIRVGASSRDIRLAGAIDLAADGSAPFPVSSRPAQRDGAHRGALGPYFDVRPHGFAAEAFRALYGRPLPEPSPCLPLTQDSPVSDLALTPIGRLALPLIRKIASGYGKGDDSGEMLGAMLGDLPLRSFCMGGMSHERLEGLVALLNGRIFAGLRRLLAG